jgi:hypothetical protein
MGKTVHLPRRCGSRFGPTISSVATGTSKRQTSSVSEPRTAASCASSPTGASLRRSGCRLRARELRARCDQPSPRGWSRRTSSTLCLFVVAPFVLGCSWEGARRIRSGKSRIVLRRGEASSDRDARGCGPRVATVTDRLHRGSCLRRSFLWEHAKTANNATLRTRPSLDEIAAPSTLHSQSSSLALGRLRHDPSGSHVGHAARSSDASASASPAS